jgi:hypothetical protein
MSIAFVIKNKKLDQMSKSADNFDPKVLGGSVKRGIFNPDLLEERAKCNFNQREMANYLFKAELV